MCKGVHCALCKGVGLSGRRMTLSHRELELVDCCRSLRNPHHNAAHIHHVSDDDDGDVAFVSEQDKTKDKSLKTGRFCRIGSDSWPLHNLHCIVLKDLIQVLSFNLRRAENLGKMLED